MMGAPLRLLGTDLDRTLLPNGAEPESPEARPRFRALCQREGLLLAYISGRDRGLVQQAIDQYALLRPHFVIGDVGTSIYDLRGGDWALSSAWHEAIGSCWAGYDHGGLEELLGDFQELRVQEAGKQNRYKLSYYHDLGVDRQALDRRLTERLDAHGVRASLIWSVDDPAGVGLLDVLPREADKYRALEFVRGALALPVASVLFAGDSGNDLPLLASEIPAVLVANASSEVREEARISAAEAGHGGRLYCAKGGFLGMNGNYSAGILEGVGYFFPGLVVGME